MMETALTKVRFIYSHCNGGRDCYWQWGLKNEAVLKATGGNMPLGIAAWSIDRTDNDCLFLYFCDHGHMSVLMVFSTMLKQP